MDYEGVVLVTLSGNSSSGHAANTASTSGDGNDVSSSTAETPPGSNSASLKLPFSATSLADHHMTLQEGDHVRTLELDR